MQSAHQQPSDQPPSYNMQSRCLLDSLPAALLFISQRTMICMVFSVGVGRVKGLILGTLRDHH